MCATRTRASFNHCPLRSSGRLPNTYGQPRTWLQRTRRAGPPFSYRCWRWRSGKRTRAARFDSDWSHCAQHAREHPIAHSSRRPAFLRRRSSRRCGVSVSCPIRLRLVSSCAQYAHEHPIAHSSIAQARLSPPPLLAAVWRELSDSIQIDF